MGSSRPFSLKNMIQFWVTLHRSQSPERFSSALKSVQEQFKLFLNSLATSSEKYPDARLKNLIIQIKYLQKNKIFSDNLSEFIGLLVKDMETGRAAQLKTLILNYLEEEEEDEEDEEDVENQDAKKSSSVREVKAAATTTPAITPYQLEQFQDVLFAQLTDEEPKQILPSSIRAGRQITEDEFFQSVFVGQHQKSAIDFYSAGKEHLKNGEMKAAQDSFNLCLVFAKEDAFYPARQAVEENDEEALPLLINFMNVNEVFPNGETLSYVAAQNNSADILQILAEKKADLKKTKPDGWAPIHVAAARNSAGAMKVLLQPEFKLDPNQALPTGSTPAFIAAGNNSADTLQILAEHKADLKKTNSDGFAPIHIAASRNSADAMKVLLQPQFKLDPNQVLPDGSTPAYLAAGSNSADTLQVLAENKADLKKSAPDGWAPVHIAAQNNAIGAMRILLQPEFQVDPNQALPGGSTAAFVAAGKNAADTLQVLAEHKADLKKTKSDGSAPIHIAAFNNSAAAMKILLKPKFQVDPNTPLPDGSTPAFIAAQNNSADTLQVLAENKADLKKTKSDGSAPIHIAAQNNAVGAMKVLLQPEFKIDPNQVTKKGEIPLCIATRANALGVLPLLINKGANLNKKEPGELGWTAVHNAIGYGQAEALKVLLDHKPDLTIKNGRGETPLEMALASNLTNFRETIELIVKHGAQVTHQMILDAFLEEKWEVIPILQRYHPQKTFEALQMFYSPVITIDPIFNPDIKTIQKIFNKGDKEKIKMAEYKQPDLNQVKTINEINKKFLQKEQKAIQAQEKKLKQTLDPQKIESYQPLQYFYMQCAHQFEVEANRLLPINKEMSVLLIQTAIDQYAKAYLYGLKEALEQIIPYKTFADPRVKAYAKEKDKQCQDFKKPQDQKTAQVRSYTEKIKQFPPAPSSATKSVSSTKASTLKNTKNK